MYKKLIYLASMADVLNLEVCKTYSIRSAGKVSLFRDFVLAVFLSVVCSLLTTMPAAYGWEGYALEVGGGRTVTIDDDEDALRLGSYTYELWMKDLEGPTGNWRNIFCKGPGDTSAGRGPLLALRENDSGVHYDHSTGSGQSTIDTYEGIPVNDWIHIALVLTDLNGEQMIYQDGVQAAVRSSSNLTDATQDPVLRIGLEANVVLDEFRVWNYARTQEEIQADMNREVSGGEEGLVGYWRFNEGEGTTAYDMSPYENHGTIVGGIWTTDTAPVAPGPAPAIASSPVPAAAATDVPPGVILSWRSGKFANTHDVYLGTVFEDINDADRTNPLNVLVSQDHDANTYSPDGHLEFAQTYYWRVDEVNAPPDDTIFTGDVWSFTVEPLAYPILGQDITVTASSSDVGKEPENSINGSGLDESGLLHGQIGDDTMWLSNRDGEQPTWIEFEFDKVYKLYEMWVWNSNESLEPVIGLGIKDVTIEYSVDGNDYMALGTAHEFARAPGMGNYAHNTTIEFNGVAAKYVRLTANSNWGGILNQYGLSEVRFFQIPVNAREPSPALGAIDVVLEPILSWRAGREAAIHNVLFSDEEQAVIDGTADVTPVGDTSFGPLDLDLGKTYYWRVDEVNGAQVWQGDLWNFTTFEYFVIDDFEDYNDYEPDRIFDTWVDGWGIDENGATVGYESPNFTAGEHFVETNIVHEGDQSMPYFYDNSVGNSEATLPLSSLRNWTEKGIGSLVLWYRGNPAGFMEDPAGTYTINASGVDIWGTADEFRYVYKQLSGDGSIIAWVESVEDTDDWAKAGVMIRQSLDPGSKFAAVYITPVNGCRFQARLTPAADATSDTSVVTTEQTAITAPYWVKVERVGDNFNGYYSSDGVNWVAMSWNPQGNAMPADVYIGLAVTSHNANETCTAVLSNVETTGTVSPQVWAEQVIGAAEMPSNDSERMYVVLDSSAVVYNNNPDAAQADEWTRWNIDLQRFADQGIDLTNIESIGIGFGDRDNPQPGGTGIVYFDDIRLYSLQPEP